ncbi:MAG: hopanoid biosynthesis-associated protein HpnK [Limisphaerales bacterium]
MGRAEGRRRLIVNADDFGGSHAINEAVSRAHREGVLTTASLMVAGDAFDEAVAIARAMPSLGVGLHLTLVHGAAVLSHGRNPGLTGPDGRFSDNAPMAGFRYWARRDLREALRAEIGAQFERFRETGLPLDHVNGHLHLHLHPVVLGLLEERAREWGVERARLTRDSLRLSLRIQRGRWFYRLSHALVFGFLARRAARVYARMGVRHTDGVFGLFADGAVDEAYLLRLLPAMPPGDFEIYSHPSTDLFPREMEALLSPGVRRAMDELGWERVRHLDL